MIIELCAFIVYLLFEITLTHSNILSIYIILCICTAQGWLLLYYFIHFTEHQFWKFNSSGPSPYANKWWQSESKVQAMTGKCYLLWSGWVVMWKGAAFFSINLRNIHIQIEGGYSQIYRFIYFIKNNSALFKRFIIVIRLICSFQAQQRTLNICFIMFFFCLFSCLSISECSTRDSLSLP